MARRRRHRDEAPGWAWMLFGLAIGLVIAVGVYVNDRRPSVERPTPRLPSETARSLPERNPADAGGAGSAAPSAETPGAEDQRFDFYELLPRYQVVVPELETPAPTASRATAIGEPGTYVLQAGSFGTEADAERRRAQLGLLGIESRVQRVVVDERTFHRVRIGPLDDLDELNSVRRRLLDADIDSLVMRMTD